MLSICIIYLSTHVINVFHKHKNIGLLPPLSKSHALFR